MTLHEWLMEALRARPGRERAVTARQLAAAWIGISRTMVTQRQVTDAIRELRDTDPYGGYIGSCPDGYYWITTTEEAEETYRYLLTPAVSALQRARKFREEHTYLPEPRQALLDFGEEGDE